MDWFLYDNGLLHERVKEKFLKSGGIKSNHENMMKSNGGIPSHHVSEKEGTCFLVIL